MVDFLLHIELHNKSSYQQQIREKLVQLIKQNTFGDKASAIEQKNGAAYWRLEKYHYFGL